VGAAWVRSADSLDSCSLKPRLERDSEAQAMTARWRPCSLSAGV
jgi:hypothetical protein